MSQNGVCTYASTDTSKFGELTPWIGLPVAFASLVCAGAMLADMIRSFSREKLWMPPRFFVFNSAIILFLEKATKVSRDTNEPMPGICDQLVKKSGILLLCLAMFHAMPSLGLMDGRQLLSNMGALGILVASAAINMSIQMYTGLITEYAFTRGISIGVMVYMYLILASYSVSVPTIKVLLEKKYEDKHKELAIEVESSASISTESLRRYVSKYWLMALTTTPDFVLRNSGMSLAAVALYYAFGVNFLTSVYYYFSDYPKDCRFKSKYEGSVKVIFYIQMSALAMGILSSGRRLCHSRMPADRFGRLKYWCTVEKYRLQKLREWKGYPLTLPFDIKNRWIMKVTRCSKDCTVNILILFQWLVVFSTRLIIFIFWCPSLAVHCAGDIVRCLVSPCCISRKRHESTSPSSPAGSDDEDLSGYVLTLDEKNKDEEERSKDIAKGWKDYPDKWFRDGQARRPDKRLLLDLLKARFASSSYGVQPRRVQILGSSPSRTSSDDRLSQGSCSLHLVTLICIIYGKLAAHSSDGERDTWKSLMKRVEEGFLYVALVDENLNKPSMRVLKAARMVWDGLTAEGKWTDVSLNKSPPETTGAEDAPRPPNERDDSCMIETDEELMTLKQIASKSMDEIKKAISDPSGIALPFDQLEAKVDATLCECLTKLPRAIFYQCSRGSYGRKEKHVKLAAKVLGETEDILKFLQGEEPPV